MDTLRPEAEAARDAEFDQVLRDIGNDLLEQEVPERLLRVLRAAAAAADQAKLKDQAQNPPAEKSSRTRGK